MFTIWLSSPTVRYLYYRDEAYIHTKTCTQVFRTVLFHTSKAENNLNALQLVNGSTNCYSLYNNNTTQWQKDQIINICNNLDEFQKPSDTSQSQKVAFYVIPFIWQKDSIRDFLGMTELFYILILVVNLICTYVEFYTTVDPQKRFGFFLYDNFKKNPQVYLLLLCFALLCLADTVFSQIEGLW